MGDPHSSSRRSTADLFLDTGTIVVQVDREPSGCRGTVTDLPIAIVASGSEVLAAAIQENGRGIVVRARPRVLPEQRGRRLRLCWLTPDRNLIEGRGVIPDIEVTLAAEDVEAARDLAVLRAIDALRALQGGAA